MRFIIPVTVALWTLAGPAVADEAPRAVEALVEALQSEDAADRIQAARDAMAIQDSKLVRPLTKALKDENDDVRLAAIQALGKRTDKSARKKAASALIARIPRKGGATKMEERLAILDALHDLAQRETIRPILDGVDAAMDLREVQARMTAVANVPHPDAIERLILFLDSGRRGAIRSQKGMANRALQYATGTKHSRDPDAWRAWWRANKKTFDFDAAMQARLDAEKEREEKAARAERKQEAQKEKRRKKRERQEEEGGASEGSDA